MLRKFLVQVHLWSGLIAGLLLAVQSITGSAVAFRETGNLWLHADEMIIQPMDTPILKISGVLTSFHGTFPEIPQNVLSVLYPQAPHETFFIRVWKNGSPAPNMYVSMNPYTGEITGWGNKWQYPFELMYRLHEQLSLGTAGIKIVHTSGFLMLLMCSTGLYLWWPRRESLRQALQIRRKPVRRFLLTAHRVIGAYSFVLVFLVALSGTMIFGVLSLLPIGPSTPSGFGMFATIGIDSDTTGKPVPVDVLIDTAQSYFPNDKIRDLSYVRLKRAVSVVSLIDSDAPNPRALNRVFFERQTGRVITVLDWDKLDGIALIEDWAIPLHSGEIIGTPGRLLVFVSGLFIPFLLITGALSWWKNLKSESLRIRRAN